MNTAHLVGNISLNISVLIYLIWFIPQLILVFRRRDISGLSLWMHCILIIGYLSDLIYGIGRHLPMQYKLVTICGLFFLAIEHYQFIRYGLISRSSKLTFHAFNGVFLIIIFFAFYSLHNFQNKNFYDDIGLVSNICWFSYVLPQIIKNYVNSSTKGLSVIFIIFSILSGVCDIISSYALGWDWPSKLGSIVGLSKKLFLLFQCYYYKPKANFSHFDITKVWRAHEAK